MISGRRKDIKVNNELISSKLLLFINRTYIVYGENVESVANNTYYKYQ